MNKKILTAAIAAMMLTALTACGGDTGSSDTAPAAESSAAEAPAAETPADIPADTAEDAPADAPADAQAEEGAAADGGSEAAGSINFDYNANGTTIVCGEPAQAVLDALGTADSTFEAPSCAFTGTSYYYTYGGMQVVTYPDEHDQTLNRIYEVDLNDATVTTNEGIKVGDTYDDIIAKYGTPDQESPASVVYKTDGKAVQFFLEGNNIKTIIYTVQIG